MDFNMYVPTKILFGAGTLNELGKQQLPGKMPLLLFPTANQPVPTVI